MNTIHNIQEETSDAASKVRETAGRTAERISETLDQQREYAADGLGRAASTLHDTAGSIPGGRKVRKLTHNIADGVGSAAGYLRESDFRQVGKDAWGLCRRYPAQSLVAALAVGFLIGRTRRG
jgi:hypothetical protein